MLQVATFNIGGARKLRQPPHDPNKVGQDAAETLRQVIDPSQPTLIGLQETGYHRYRDDGPDVERSSFKSFAKAMGADSWRADFAPEVDTAYHPHERLWNRPAYDVTANGGLVQAAEGNAIATNLPAAAWPWPAYTGYDPNAHDGTRLNTIVTQISGAALYSSGSRDTQPRNLMVTSVEHPTYGPLVFMNTHLGTVTGENRHNERHVQSRLGKVRRLNEVWNIMRATDELRYAEQETEDHGRPIILVGDFNAVPKSVPMRLLSTRRSWYKQYELVSVKSSLFNRWTHRDHKILIDHILISDPARILPEPRVFIQTDLPHDDLTDHRPVIAIFE